MVDYYMSKKEISDADWFIALCFPFEDSRKALRADRKKMMEAINKRMTHRSEAFRAYLRQQVNRYWR